MNTKDQLNSIYWSNLCLLGFSPASYQRKYKVDFYPQMFEKSNVAGMQILMYFLLRKINPTETVKDFEELWPISKGKSTPFKKLVAAKLQRLEARAVLAPNSSKALNFPMKERFYTLLRQLSEYALKKVMKRDYGQEQQLLPQLSAGLRHAKVIKKTLLLQLKQENEEFVLQVARSAALQQRWSCFADTLSKHLATLSSLRKQAANKTQLRGVSQSNKERTETQLTALRSFWRQAENFDSSSAAYLRLLESVVHENQQQLTLKLRGIQGKAEGGSKPLAPLTCEWNASLEKLDQALKPCLAALGQENKRASSARLQELSKEHASLCSNLANLRKQVKVFDGSKEASPLTTSFCEETTSSGSLSLIPLITQLSAQLKEDFTCASSVATCAASLEEESQLTTSSAGASLQSSTLTLLEESVRHAHDTTLFSLSSILPHDLSTLQSGLDSTLLTTSPFSPEPPVDTHKSPCRPEKRDEQLSRTSLVQDSARLSTSSSEVADGYKSPLTTSTDDSVLFNRNITFISQLDTFEDSSDDLNTKFLELTP